MELVSVAKVALSAATFAIDKPYSYFIPTELQKSIEPGMRVIIPFGPGNRRVEGLVLAVESTCEPIKNLKPLFAQLDETPVLDAHAIKLALWMREQWFCTVYDAARAMLPAGLYFSLQNRYRLADGISPAAAYEAAGRSEQARRMIELVCANPKGIELKQIRIAFGTKDPTSAIRLLLKKGILSLETAATRGIGDKNEQIAVLIIPPEDALALVKPKRRTAPQRYAVIELLCSAGSLSTKDLCYFTGASKATIRSLAKGGLIALEQRQVSRHAIKEPIKQAPPIILSQEQNTALEGLLHQYNRNVASAALLYGVTGSGKTRIYIRLIQEVLEAGGSAMVLVPEISLTPQLLRLFSSYFGSLVAVLHSSLRAGERYDEWKRVKAGQARVVIGTRSAVFAPLKQLKLIILDEEQEYSYKSENVPKYHARDVAKYRCAQNNALLLLGSATPSVESMYLARKGVYQLYTLSHRYNNYPLPDVIITDMRQELKGGNGSSISRALQQALLENIKAGEQSILFLNRRGANRMVVCGECGEVPACPRCSVYLTYHSVNSRLMCHFCGHSEPLPSACPQCGGSFEFVGAGTQKIQEELGTLFPNTPTLRMDTDTISASQSHEKLLTQFELEKIPILLGTQMVTKGLDFENVTLVGVIAADLSLFSEDYRAGERTFSLLTQVVGRAGRGSRRGRAIIQTFTPSNEVITCASRQDYDCFYDQEIALRQMRRCPPFRDLYVISVSGLEESTVLHACIRLQRNLRGWLAEAPYCNLEAELLGPAPASVVRVNDRFRYHLTLSCQNTRLVREMIAHLVRCAQQDRENKGISISADVNPLD